MSQPIDSRMARDAINLVRCRRRCCCCWRCKGRREELPHHSNKIYKIYEREIGHALIVNERAWSECRLLSNHRNTESTNEIGFFSTFLSIETWREIIDTPIDISILLRYDVKGSLLDSRSELRMEYPTVRSISQWYEFPSFWEGTSTFSRVSSTMDDAHLY